MALRTLAARTRNCALRLSAPATCVSDPAAPRRALYSTPPATRVSLPAAPRRALYSTPPATRVSHPAAPRRALYSTPPAGQQHSKGFDPETASDEELMRQAHLAEKEIGECFKRVRLEKKKLPRIWQDMFGTMKLWVCAGAVIELLGLSANYYHRAAAKEPDE